jgi:glycosyltransferase involved in cell wall biosynthesis
MRVLFLAPQPFFVERGTPIAVRDAVAALARAGHVVDLVTLHGGEDIAIPGVRLVRAARPPFVGTVPIGLSPAKLACDVALTIAAMKLLRASKYDVIHAVEEAVFPAVLLKSFTGSALVYDMDSLMSEQVVEKWPRLRWLRPALRGVEEWAVRRADIVLPVCAAIAHEVAAMVPDATIHVLPDVATAAPSDARPDGVQDLRATFGPSVSLALYVGNLEAYQGVDLLIEAMARLPKTTACGLVVVGGSADAIARAKAHAESSGSAARVHFTGPAPLSHLPYLLSQADILCSPRLTGVNTPMKIYSYMASGRAILATSILSHTQVLDGTMAKLVTCESEAMARALTELVDDPGLRDRLGGAAEHAASENCSIAAFEQRLSTAYADLSSRNAAS